MSIKYLLTLQIYFTNFLTRNIYEKKMKTKFTKLINSFTLLLLICTLYFILVQSCNTTEPGDNKNTPPDTTRNNFTWQKFTFGGEVGSCSLYDVAIIDENNIWAVGAIYLKDSTGQPDPEQYAVAHWNGSKWELMKLRFNCHLYYPNCGPETRLITSGHSIFARSKDDIWIAASSIHHYDGSKWTEEAGILGAGNANAIWGNENELWFVGNGGFIAHRSKNGQWNEIESRTELNINDIWGNTGDDKIITLLAAASNLSTNNAKKLLRIKNDIVDTLEWIPQITLYTVWFRNLNKIYAGGDGLYIYNEKGWKSQSDIPNDFIFRVRGDMDNNIFITGGFGFTAHFNGNSWKQLEEASLQSGNYEGLDVKGNIVVLVGFEGNAAIATIGRRQ